MNNNNTTGSNQSFTKNATTLGRPDPVWDRQIKRSDISAPPSSSNKCKRKSLIFFFLFSLLSLFFHFFSIFAIFLFNFIFVVRRQVEWSAASMASRVANARDKEGEFVLYTFGVCVLYLYRRSVGRPYHQNFKLATFAFKGFAIANVSRVYLENVKSRPTWCSAKKSNQNRLKGHHRRVYTDNICRLLLLSSFEFHLSLLPHLTRDERLIHKTHIFMLLPPPPPPTPPLHLHLLSFVQCLS